MIGIRGAGARPRLSLTMAAWCCFALALARIAGAVVLRDDLGRRVDVPTPPRRIVSLLPSLTETVCALGACDHLIAVGRFDDWPPAIRGLPRVGDLDQVSVERIVALHPDLVLLSNSQRAANRLGELGIPAFAIETDRYQDIARSIRLVGALLGRPRRAAALIAHIQAQVRRVCAAAIAARHGAAPSVYFEVDPAPYAAGPDSYIGGLMTRLGVRNIVPANLGLFPLLNPEFVVRANPDIIVVSRLDARRLAQRPGWAGIRAVRERHLCEFPAAVRDTIVRPGPRIAEGLRALAGCFARYAR